MPLSTMKRVLLKLSGEVLMGDQQFGIDPAFVMELAREVKTAKETGLERGLILAAENRVRSAGSDQNSAEGPASLASANNRCARAAA